MAADLFGTRWCKFRSNTDDAFGDKFTAVYTFSF